MRVTVNVVAGQGETEFDAGGWGQDLYITPPDSTPLFDIALYNRRGEFILGKKNMDDPKPKIEGRYKTSVAANIVRITNAADDGAYLVEVPLE